jgi:hypothetical protein
MAGRTGGGFSALYAPNVYGKCPLTSSVFSMQCDYCRAVYLCSSAYRSTMKLWKDAALLFISQSPQLFIFFLRSCTFADDFFDG